MLKSNYKQSSPYPLYHGKETLTERMDKMELTNTPYDDVFRTLLNDCGSLIIPVINEVFGEHYTGERSGHIFTE